MTLGVAFGREGGRKRKKKLNPGGQDNRLEIREQPILIVLSLTAQV